MTYRIATDGIRFRIEYQTHTFWRKRVVWKHYENIVTDPLGPPWGELYDTEADARKALEEIMREETAVMGGWRPVGDPIEVVWTNG